MRVAKDSDAPIGVDDARRIGEQRRAVVWADARVCSMATYIAVDQLTSLGHEMHTTRDIPKNEPASAPFAAFFGF